MSVNAATAIAPRQPLQAQRRRRPALVIAQALVDAASDQAGLERELVAVFDSMGFDAVPLGGKGRADGHAHARLSADKDGKSQAYSVSLEAKSKEELGKTVSAKAVGISTLARHRKKLSADHTIVIAPEFPTSKGEASALADEINDDRKNERSPDPVPNGLRPYQKPAFKHERVFETMALACGKIEGTLPQHRVTKLSPRPAGPQELGKLFEDAMTAW